MLDSDLSSYELANAGLGDDINTEKEIQPLYFTTIEELVMRIISSKSEVTIFTSGTTGQPKKIIF